MLWQMLQGNDNKSTQSWTQSEIYYRPRESPGVLSPVREVKTKPAFTCIFASWVWLWILYVTIFIPDFRENQWLSQWQVRWEGFFSAKCLRRPQYMSSTTRIASSRSPLARRQRQWRLRKGAVMFSFNQAVGFCCEERLEVSVLLFRPTPTRGCTSSLRQWKRTYPACKSWYW